jgi:hypothetical protein
MAEIYTTFCPKYVLWTVSSYMTWQIIPLYSTQKQAMTFRRNFVRQLIGTFTSRKRTGRKRSLPIGTAFPNLFHTFQKISGRADGCALCLEKKKKAPSGRGKQTTYKCKQCDLPLCHVGSILEYPSSEMWRCKIRRVGYYMHIFIMNKMKKELSFCLF